MRDSSKNADPHSSEMWGKSRAGAWAARGFDYQHLVSTLILVRQWAGLAPLGYLVPEGIEDCVIESLGRNIWIQIKSRKKGAFSSSEIGKLLKDLEAKVSSIKNGEEFRTALILEKPCPDIRKAGIDQLFEDDSRKVFVCPDPSHEITSLLLKQLGAAEVTTEGIASNLYRFVADSSGKNAPVGFDARIRISTTEVERRILEHLESSDPSAIDKAFLEGFLKPVDFFTRIDEPNFYQGIKVKPGHVAADLVIDRPDDVSKVISALTRQRHTLVSGPSGAGKSALLWLSAETLAKNSRLFQITGSATVADAEDIIRFVRARRPTSVSPIVLIFDEVGSTNSDFWNVLAFNLRELPEVYFLGSVRHEDVNLIADRADTGFVSISLDENLAASVWQKLCARNQTNWSHWREPFEQSEGLMLEYVHLLTRGKHLDDVIGEQVRQRETQDRNDELAIIRSTSVLCARGGEVKAKKLFELLGLEPDAANRSLRRLIDEHLVREDRPGVLGGLHTLRSNALRKASHDETVFLIEDTLWRSLAATTKETLPRLIQSLIADLEKQEEDHVLLKLAEMLGQSHEIDLWTAVLTGLGLATLERSAVSFISILEQCGLHRHFWRVASMFAILPDSDIIELSNPSQSKKLRDSVSAFQASSVNDLRSACLKKLPKENKPPSCCSIEQANELLSCLVPIFGSKPVEIPLEMDFTKNDDLDINQIAIFLSTAYLISLDLAKNFVKNLGGEQFLFDLFHSQTPWVTAPAVKSNGTHGRTVRSDLLYLGEKHQTDPHSTIVSICETLIALSPKSTAVACDAVWPTRETVSIGEFRPWSKNIPRQNLPPETRVAWNVAFSQILESRFSTTNMLTSYTLQMNSLVERTEKVFRSYTEKWIKKKYISDATAYSLAGEINEIADAVAELGPRPKPTASPYSMTEPAEISETDDIGDLLISTLTNLLFRLNKRESVGATATFAGGLAVQARDHSDSDMWRTMPTPNTKLAVLSNRLDDVACVLHEMARYGGRPSRIPGIMKPVRKAYSGKAVSAAAKHCRSLADRRFRKKLLAVEKAFKEKGWTARCVERTLEQGDSHYWPARDIAILVTVPDLETGIALYYEQCPMIAKQSLGDDWPFRTVPVVNDLLLPYLALNMTSTGPMPDADFFHNWSDRIDCPSLESEILERFGKASEACIIMSGIIACCSPNNVHPKEAEAFSQAEKTFERNYDFIVEAVERTGSENLELAQQYLCQSRLRVGKELEDTNSGNAVDNPLYRTAYLSPDSKENEDAFQLTYVHLTILQDELSQRREVKAKKKAK